MRRTDLLTALVATAGILLGCCAGAQGIEHQPGVDDEPLIDAAIARGEIEADTVVIMVPDPAYYLDDAVIHPEDYEGVQMVPWVPPQAQPDPPVHEGEPGVLPEDVDKPSGFTLVPPDDDLARDLALVFAPPDQCGGFPFRWDADAGACVTDLTLVPANDLPTIVRVSSACGPILDVTIPSCPKETP